MPNVKRMRIPITAPEKAELSKMLGEVPNKKVIQYDWTSEAGQAFIKQVRALQVKGSVPLPWIAEALEVSPAALAGAVGYWERASATRGSSSSRRKTRQPRPLRKGTGSEG